VAVLDEVQWTVPPAADMDCIAAFQHMGVSAGLAMLVAEQQLADEVFWRAPVGPPERVVTCSLPHVEVVPGKCVQGVLEEGFGKWSDGLDTAVGDSSPVLEADVVVHTALADDPLLESPLQVENGVEASKATAAGGIVAAVVSCLEVDHGACLVIQAKAQSVAACSYQEVGATLA
jgi:hypothetical protein